MEGDWSSREGRLGPAQTQDFCVPERDTSSVHLSQVSLDGGYGGSEACSSDIFHHCQQPSYAHSEGYYSYVSSTDSITPFIDRLKRELEFTEIHENNHCSGNNHGGSKWEESDTDGFREKTCVKESSDSVWQDGSSGTARDRTSYRAAGGSTRLSSPPLPSTDPKLTYLSRVPLFRNTSYESIGIDNGPRLSTSHVAGGSTQPNPSVRQTDSSCISHKSTRVQSSHNISYRSTDIVHTTRSSSHHSDREHSDTRPTKLVNGNTEITDISRGPSANRDPSDSVRLNRVQQHSPRLHSNQSSSNESSVSFPSKSSPSSNDSIRLGQNRSDSLNSSFRSHISNTESSLNSISRSNSTDSSISSRIYPSQTQTSESANIARSSRIPPPQRHLSQSVLYLSADHRKLFPISTYQPEPPRVVGAVSVSERVVELESRFGGLKALQKKALLSFYQRHQAAVPAPPPPPRRASSASDYLQLKGGLDAVSSSSSSSQSSKEATIPLSTPSSLSKDNKQHHRSCGSLSGISGPVIVGRSISVDDWVPARPPKKAHLRPRPSSPEPPPPPSSPPQQYSDEPLPPPPGPDELPLSTPSLPSRHPSPGPQVPTTKSYPSISESRPSTDQQCRPLKTHTVQSQFSSSSISHSLDIKPQKLNESSFNECNGSTTAKPIHNGSIPNHTKHTDNSNHSKKVDLDHKDIHISEPRSPTNIKTIVDHPTKIVTDHNDIRHADQRSPSHIKNTPTVLDQSKKIGNDHKGFRHPNPQSQKNIRNTPIITDHSKMTDDLKDTRHSDQRLQMHLRNTPTIMDHSKTIDNDHKDIRHIDQQSQGNMRSTPTILDHSKMIDSNHKDIRHTDQRLQAHVRNTPSILDHSKIIDNDNKDSRFTDQRSQSHLRSTPAILDHSKIIDSNHKDIRHTDQRSQTNLRNTPSILDHSKIIDSDHNDTHQSDQRSLTHIRNSPIILDHSKMIDNDNNDVRHNEQRPHTIIRSTSTSLEHSKIIDSDHKDIRHNDHRSQTKIRNNPTIQEPQAKIRTIPTSVDHSKTVESDHKDFFHTDQRSQESIRNTPTILEPQAKIRTIPISLDNSKVIDSEHKDTRHSPTENKSSGIISALPADISSDHKTIRLSEPRSPTHTGPTDQRKGTNIEVLPRYHRVNSSSSRSTPVPSEYQIPSRLFRTIQSEIESDLELSQSVSTLTTLASNRRITTPSGESFDQDPLCDVQSGHRESNLTPENAATNRMKDVQPSQSKVNLSRTHSTDSLYQCERDKIKKTDDSRSKQSKPILRKTSFRCSEKIQQSIDSLHNSLRGSHSKPDSPPPLIKQLMEEESEGNLQLSTTSLTQLDCIAFANNLSASPASLCDVDVDKDDKSGCDSTFISVSSGLDSLSVGTLQQKKEELVTRLSRKLSVLRAEAAAVAEETSANEELGEAVVERVSTAWGPREGSRLRSHVADLGRLTALLLTLTTRLARADNALLALSSSHPDKSALETKRDRLASQLEEARRLKEKVDKRNETVTNKLKDRLTPDEYTDFMHFVSLKSKLLLDSREIADKIKLGEEQIQALQMTLSVVT